MFEFSCADYTFPLLSRVRAFSLLHLLDFKWVDIGLFERNPHFLPSELMTAGRDFVARVQQDLSVAELEVADIFLQVGLDPGQSSTNDPERSVRTRNREVFLRALDLCIALGCGHMTGLPGVDHGRGDLDLEVASEEIAWRLDQARQGAVAYSIEPHIGSICPDTAAVHRLLSKVSGLTLTLDYGHFISLGEDSSAVHALLPSASHIHARGGSRGRLQTSVAENQIDFAGMLSGLRGDHYPGKIALEYVWVDWHGCNRSDNVSETILLRQLLQHVAVSLQQKAG
jgi:sugar phosphate isomerase/epimerase